MARKRLRCHPGDCAQPPTVSQCLTGFVTKHCFLTTKREIPAIAQAPDRDHLLCVIHINECADKPQAPRRCHLPGEWALERAGWAPEPWLGAFPARRSIHDFCCLSSWRGKCKDDFWLKEGVLGGDSDSAEARELAAQASVSVSLCVRWVVPPPCSVALSGRGSCSDSGYEGRICRVDGSGGRTRG